MAKFVPQSAYAEIIRTVQQQWTFIQRVIPNIANLFSSLEKSILTYFYLYCRYTSIDRRELKRRLLVFHLLSKDGMSKICSVSL